MSREEALEHGQHFLRIEVAQLRESFALLPKWVPEELQSYRILHTEPSDTPESMFGVQKLLGEPQ